MITIGMVIIVAVIIRRIVAMMISPPRISVVGSAPVGIVVRHAVAEAPVWRVVMVAKAPIPIAIPWIDDSYIVIAAAVGRTMESVDTSRVAIVHDDFFYIAIVGVRFAVGVFVRRNVGIGVTLRIVGIALRIVRVVVVVGTLHGNHLSCGPHAIHIVDIYARWCRSQKYCAGAEANSYCSHSRKTCQFVYQCFHFYFLHALVCSTKFAIII